MFVIVNNIFACFALLLSALQVDVWSKNDVGSPTSTSFISTFHIGSMFCFFPASCMSSTYTDKDSPFSRLTNKHSNLELYPNRVPKALPRIPFPIIVQPKNDRTDFVQEERLGLPFWTMMLATCVVVDLSKYLDILTWNFQKRWCIFHSDLRVS